MQNEKRILWTRQVAEVVKELEDTGCYTVKKEHIKSKNGDIAPYYLDLYEWFTKEAGKYIEIEEGHSYPIWLSMDNSLMLQPTEGTVILELEVPVDKVLIVNDAAWGYRVNYWYVPKGDEDEKRHNEMLKKYDIANESDLILGNRGSYYPAIRRKIIDSWQRVFTQMPKEEKHSVATMWKLEKSWIKKIHHYG